MTDSLNTTTDARNTTNDTSRSPSRERRRRFPFWSSGPPVRTPRFTQKATGASAKNYDFAAARPPGRKTNFIESVGHLVKSCLGGGIVSIHTSYKSCGLWTALVLNVILGFLVSYLMIILAHSAQKVYGRCKVPAMSYPDLAEAALDIGPWPKLKKRSRIFRYLVDATIMIDLFGSCCCYQLIIARSIKQLLESSTGSEVSLRVYVACLLIPCILLCMITTLKYLAPFSIVADVVIIMVAISTVVYGMKAATKAPSDFPVFHTFEGMLSFMGVCVFSMEGVGVTLAVENQMQDPKKITQVLVCGMTTVIIMVMTVGFFGYYGFGDKAESPVTLNFEFGPFATSLKTAMAVMIYVTFALNFWVPFDLSWHYIQKKYKPDRFWFIERIYRAIFVTIITAVAFAFPVVDDLMSVIGAFCLSNMGFIYPAFIELSLDWEDPGLGFMKWRLLKFLAILGFGLFLMIMGTVSNINNLIRNVFGISTDVTTTEVPTSPAEI